MVSRSNRKQYVPSTDSFPFFTFCRYDFKITEVVKKNVKGTIHLGEDKASIENCLIHFIDEIFRIEKSSLLAERTTDEFPTNIVKSKSNKEHILLYLVESTHIIAK